MSKDPLGDRMKMYEGVEAERRFMPLLPIMARLDGRNFSNFTKGLDRPFDTRFVEAMHNTTRFLVESTGAKMGYTQSDEITLVWYSDDIKSQVWFDSRILKINTQLAAQASVFFNEEVAKLLPPLYKERRPTFDARAWNVPNKVEAANNFLWREQDATKNSLSMAASHYYSHNVLQGKGGSERHDMLMAKGINWNDYPDSFKRGAYFQRQVVDVPLSLEELESLHPKHHARTNPEVRVKRNKVMQLDLPPFGTIKNKVEVIFDGAVPESHPSARLPSDPVSEEAR